MANGLPPSWSAVLSALTVSWFFVSFCNQLILTAYNLNVWYSLMQSVLVELGINENEDSPTTTANSGNRPPSKLFVYQQHFEKSFIESTQLYYKQESTDFVQNNTVTEYLKKVWIWRKIGLKYCFFGEIFAPQSCWAKYISSGIGKK